MGFLDAPAARALKAGNRFVFLGDSITAGTDNTTLASVSYKRSIPALAQLYSAGKIITLRNGGVPSERSDQIALRVTNDVIAYGPGRCVILAGTNDALQSVSVSTFQTNMVGIFRHLIATGITPVLCTLPPNNTAGTHPLIIQYNYWLRDYAARNGLLLIDFYSLLTNPGPGASSGNWSASYVGDGTHPNENGYMAMAKLVSDTLAPYLPPSPLPLSASTDDTLNILYNPLFTQDSNSDGIPDNTTGFSGTAGSYTHALVTDSAVVGKMAQITQTAGGTTRGMLWQSRLGAGLLSGGDLVQLSGVLTTDGAAQTNVYLQFVKADGSTLVDGIQHSTFSTGSSIGYAITRGVFQIELTAPALSAGVNVSFTLNGVSSGTAVASVGRLGVYNLTQMGTRGS